MTLIINLVLLFGLFLCFCGFGVSWALLPRWKKLRYVSWGFQGLFTMFGGLLFLFILINCIL